MHRRNEGPVLHRSCGVCLAAVVMLALACVPVRAQFLTPPPTANEASMWDVAFSDSLTGTAVGDYGYIQHTTDGGRTWSSLRSTDQFAFRVVCFCTPSIGVAAGFWGTVYRTVDSGASWSRLDVGTKHHFSAIASHGARVWMGGDKGVLYFSDDCGATWRGLPTGTTKVISGITFADSLHGWCVSAQDAMLRTTDGGRTWTPQATKAALPLLAVHAESRDVCWAAGYSGQVYKTEDGGLTWRRRDAYDAVYQHIAFDQDGRGWATGSRGAITRMNDGGDSWRLFRLAKTKAVHSIAFPKPGIAVAVGDDGAMFRFSTDPAEQARIEREEALQKAKDEKAAAQKKSSASPQKGAPSPHAKQKKR